MLIEVIVMEDKWPDIAILRIFTMVEYHDKVLVFVLNARASQTQPLLDTEQGYKRKDIDAL